MKQYLAIVFCIGLFINSFAQTFSEIVNENIPDDGTTIYFEILVTGLPAVIDEDFGVENICINLTHTWDSDLQIKIFSPDGTNTLLVNGVGGDGDDFTNTCFNAEAPYPIGWGTAPFTGSYIPMGDLGLLNNGQDPNGIWKLEIYDTYAFADEGFMIDWNITFSDNPAVAFYLDSSFLPIVFIETLDGEIVNEPKVEATFSIIDNGLGEINYLDDAFSYDGKILVELQGYTGPYYPKKNYDFDLVNADGIEIDTSLLGLPAENDFILKAEYLDGSLLKNALTYEMARRMGRYAPRTIFCEVILNNEYLGVYTLTEKIKRDSNRVDIANLTELDIDGDELTGGYIIEINENGYANDWNSDFDPINSATCGLPVAYKMVYPRSEFVQPEQLNYIHHYVDSFENALASDTFLDSILGYRNYISVKSFIDFMLVNEFSGNYDSYGRSTFLFKDKNRELNAGPAWDYDRAFDQYSWPEGWVWENTHPYWPFPFWWNKFREDPEWRDEVYCRFTDLYEDNWSLDAMIYFIDSVSNYIHDAANRNFNKWSELGVSNYTDQVEVIKDYITYRLGWIENELEDDVVESPDAAFESNSISEFDFAFIPVELNADSYLWDFGDGQTSTVKNPVHHYDLVGSYTVSLSINKYYGCESFYSKQIEVFVGIEEDRQNEIQLFPNPCTSQLYISLMNESSQSIITIYNEMGEVVFIQKRNTTTRFALPVFALLPGIYFLEISDAEKIRNAIFVKQ